MKSIQLISIIAATALLGACAGTAGNTKMADQTQESVAAFVIEGKTTKEDLKAKLGDPTAVSFTDGGNEIWTYTYSRATAQAVNYVPIVNLFARGFDTKTKRLIVMFNKDNVVTKSTMSESTGETQGGIGK